MKNATLIQFEERLKRIVNKIDDETLSEQTRQRERWILAKLLVRKELWLQQDGKCACCNRETYLDPFPGMQKQHLATYEHVTPKSMGGPHTKENGKITCSECNSKRGVEPFDEFVAKVRKHGLTAMKTKQKMEKKADRRKMHELAWALNVLWTEREQERKRERDSK